MEGVRPRLEGTCRGGDQMRVVRPPSCVPKLRGDTVHGETPIQVGMRLFKCFPVERPAVSVSCGGVVDGQQDGDARGIEGVGRVFMGKEEVDFNGGIRKGCGDRECGEKPCDNTASHIGGGEEQYRRT